MMSGVAIPLAMVSAGETVRLVSIHGCENVQHRLAAMGLTPGVEISVLQDNGGPLLIAVRDSRVALGRGLANKVMVSLEGAGEADSVQAQPVHHHRHHHRQEHGHEENPRRAGRQSKRW